MPESANYGILYIPLVEFMAEICGKHYEIILHDTSTPERSLLERLLMESSRFSV